MRVHLFGSIGSGYMNLTQISPAKRIQFSAEEASGGSGNQVFDWIQQNLGNPLTITQKSALKNLLAKLDINTPKDFKKFTYSRLESSINFRRLPRDILNEIISQLKREGIHLEEYKPVISAEFDENPSNRQLIIDLRKAEEHYGKPISQMTDRELLLVNGVGSNTLKKIKEALSEAKNKALKN